MPLSGLMAGHSGAGPSVPDPDLFPFRNLLKPLLPLERVRELYRRALQPINRSLLENLLKEMQVTYNVTSEDLARVPAEGPVLVTANHPLGILDGALLGALLLQVRTDVKILTNFLLSGVPELQEYCIFVDPYAEEEYAGLNRRGMRQALEWLSSGGMLITFPAGEVSYLRFPQFEVSDPNWHPATARLIRTSGASALPVFLHGQNRAAMRMLSRIHPSLRTAWLLTEFLQQKNRTIEVRIGTPVPAKNIAKIGAGREATDYMRWRTYLLAQRGASQWQFPNPLPAILPKKKQDPIAESLPAQSLLQDIGNLGPCVAENREFQVFIAEAKQIPHLMQELGRLREVTFRAAGEGTGRRSDLDHFDLYYRHVLLWSKANRELVGSYRMALTSEVLPTRGIGGLYTSTVFRYDHRVFEQLGPALELGRSFVRLEYQRQFAPLLMLWKGIGHFLSLHLDVAVVFGAVSVSNCYNRTSRELIVRFFRAQQKKDEFAKLIRPRRPFRGTWIRPGDCLATCNRLRDLNELADPISDVESDGKSIPILLKHYAKLGGRLLSFNVDRKFSDALDGLVLVDLRQTDPLVLERYMGKEGVANFRKQHNLTS